MKLTSTISPPYTFIPAAIYCPVSFLRFQAGAGSIKNIRRLFFRFFFFSITLLMVMVTKANFTVPAGTIVRADTIAGYSGVLTINGTLNITRNTVLPGFTSVVINAPSGQIYWTNNSDLSFAAGTGIVIKESAPGLRPGGGNSSQRLWVGTTLVAVANNNSGPAALSFADMNAAGGLPEFTLAVSAVAACTGDVITATILPLNINISYDCIWSVDNGAGISPAAVSNFNTAKTTVITPLNVGTAKIYTVTCKLYKAGDGDAITVKTITVTVNPTPSTPVMATVSPAAVCQGSAVQLSATASGNSIEWYDMASGGAPVLTCTGIASCSLKPAKSSNYYAGALVAATGCRSVSRAFAGAVAVSQPSAGGVVNGGGTVCSGMNNTLLTAGNYAGSILRWESSADNFITVNTIHVSSDTLVISNLTADDNYRMIVANGVCPAAASSTALVKVSGLGHWLGVSTNWNDPDNWCNRNVPADGADIFIDGGLLYYPVISNDVQVNNIAVAAGAMIKIQPTGRLSIGGRISSNAGIDAGAGTLALTGSTIQTISAANFSGNTLNNLTVSNTLAGASAAYPSVQVDAGGGMLYIAGAVSFGNVNNAVLQTNDLLTLLSSHNKTASIADITNNNNNSNNAIAGKVVIERYIPARRAWRFLTAPVTAGSNVTISEAWQEGARVTDPAADPALANPAPGYGTHVSFGYPIANPGYDLNSTGNTSIKYFTSLGANGIPAATNTGNITDQPAYLLFIRGDRSTRLSLGTQAPLTSTVLRMKGFVNSGIVNVALKPGFKSGASSFRVLRNPFASAINFHTILQNPVNASGNFADAFYVWDANLGGPTGTGGWVALSYNSASGRYDKSVASDIDATGNIESGTAVLLDYDGVANNVAIRESDKVNESNVSMLRTAGSFKSIRTSLFGKNEDASPFIIDAAMVSFDEYNNNDIDRKDMLKMENFAESFSLMSDEHSVAIERRKPLTENDTIFYHMANMQQRSYQLKIEMESMNLPEGTAAFLEDLFLKTKTSVNINANTLYDFDVDTTILSAQPGRFRLVFHPSGTGLSSRQRKGVTVLPNPVMTNTIRLQLDAAAGAYKIRLLNNAGSMVIENTVYHTGGKAIHLLDSSSNLLNGAYQLQVVGPDKTSSIVNVIVQKK